MKIKDVNDIKLHHLNVTGCAKLKLFKGTEYPVFCFDDMLVLLVTYLVCLFCRNNGLLLLS